VRAAPKRQAQAPGHAAADLQRLAYLDCFSGIAGNMLLGAIVDAGVSPRLIAAAARRVVKDFRLQVTDAARGHLGGKLVRVAVGKNREPERRLPEIERLISASGLPPTVVARSLAVFRRLAAAESRVHRVRPEEVHFHETGAVDAMVDVVGSVAGLFALGVDAVFCSPLPLAGGEVECAHGRLPLPAPAVLELLAGVPVKGVAGEGELVTPTGAALAVGLASGFGPLPAMTIERTGVGLGSRDDHQRPNLMRLIVGRAFGAAETVVQLEAAVDDMPGEHFDFLLERLHAAGALEVLLIPAQMKKNRPGVLVRALCPPADRAAVRDALLNHSTTLGVREHEAARTVLPREIRTVATRYGRVRVKLALRPDGSRRRHPEYDDLKRAAAAAGVSLSEVEREALAALRAEEGEP
jgi:hypothetical protein